MYKEKILLSDKFDIKKNRIFKSQLLNNTPVLNIFILYSTKQTYLIYIILK